MFPNACAQIRVLLHLRGGYNSQAYPGIKAVIVSHQMARVKVLPWSVFLMTRAATSLSLFHRAMPVGAWTGLRRLSVAWLQSVRLQLTRLRESEEDCVSLTLLVTVWNLLLRNGMRATGVPITTSSVVSGGRDLCLSL